MNKTPEEIKQGLECCYGNEERRFCEMCPFGVKTDGIYPAFICSNFDAVGEGALALIQRLQAENAEQAEMIEYLKAEIEEYEESADKCCYESRCNAELNKLEALCKRLRDENEQLEDHLREATKKIEQLEAERDAIMQDMNKNCTSCKHSGMNNPDNPCYKFEEQCRDYSKWEWRGVQKEANNGDLL